MYPPLKTIVRAALGKIARYLHSRRHLARAAVATCGSSRPSTDHCPARITFEGLTAHDLAPPEGTHHRLQLLPRRGLRHRMARFGLSRRKSELSRKNVRSSASALPTDCPKSTAIVDSGGPCPIPRRDHRHQISIASTRGPRVRATRFLQRLPMAHDRSCSRCKASQKPHNCTKPLSRQSPTDGEVAQQGRFWLGT